MVSKSNTHLLLEDPANQALVPLALRRAILGEQLLTEDFGTLNRHEGEAFLKICVEQLEWIKAAERALLESLRDPQRQGPDIQSEIVGSMLRTIRELYQTWHDVAQKAGPWLAQLRQQASDLEHHSSFAEASQYAARRVTQFGNEDFLYQDLTPEEAAEARAILTL